MQVSLINLGWFCYRIITRTSNRSFRCVEAGLMDAEKNTRISKSTSVKKDSIYNKSLANGLLQEITFHRMNVRTRSEVLNVGVHSRVEKG